MATRASAGHSRRCLALMLAATAAGVGLGAAHAAARAPRAAPAAGAGPAAWVDVFVGTSGTAKGGPIDTFPGATLPFGMIQWSPDTTTQPEGGGYNYPDRRITGFSLTHLSGPGCGVAGDIRILPTSGPVRAPYSAAEAFTHRNEQGSPGWYAVTLGRAAVRAELTVTERTGLGRFTFPAGPRGNLLFDVSSNQAGVTAASFRVDGPRQVSGSATGGNFCGAPDRYTVYFVARFNRPIAATGTWRRTRVSPGSRSVRGIESGGWVSFDTAAARSIEAQVAISYVSRADALANLRAAGGSWDLQAMRRHATSVWNGMLKRIDVTGGTPEELTTFYTALYHTLLEPTIYSDANGLYRGFDGKVHPVAAGHIEYANYSGWDIYRTEVPLISLLAPRRVSDMMQSLVDAGHQGGWLPKWPLENGYTGVMGGDAADIILAGAWAFGARDFDARAALQEMVKGATDTHSPPGQGWYVERPGLRQYLSHGYVADRLSTSVAPVPNGSSETLEYAEADFSIAQLAADLGDRPLHETFLRRSSDWENLFDTATGLISARTPGGALARAPVNSNGQIGFQEGDAAQYTWMVPQDLRDLIRGMGGRAAARRRLDVFFTHLNAGQSAPYAWLGNEPSLGSPWVYLTAGAPWRAQAVLRTAINRLYGDSPAGIPGNDDLGTMSAWYVWTAMGLYPQNPSVRLLDLGSPLFRHVTLRSPGGPTIEIDAPAAAADAPYVHGLSVEGHPSERTWIALPLRGTVRLHFDLSRTPDTQWGAAPADAPPSFSPGPTHFPVTADAWIRPGQRQTRVSPGATAPLSFDARAGASATSLRWRAVAPAGLEVRPRSGVIEARAQAPAAVRLRITARQGLREGYYDVAIRAHAANGARLPGTELIVRVALPGHALPLVYVASDSDNTVTAVDPATHGIGPAVAVGENPVAVLASPNGARIYVANQSSNTVSVLDAASQKVVSTIKVGSGPAALALSPHGRTLWVANGNANTVQRIDTRTLRAGEAIPVGLGPSGLALAGHTLYVANGGSNSVTAIDTEPGRAEATLPAGAGPAAIAAAPGGRTLYVVDANGNDIMPIDARTGAALAPIPTGLAPRSIAVSPDGKLLYVGNSAVDTLTPIEASSGRDGAPIHVGRGPMAVAFARDGRQAYVVDGQTGNLAIVDVGSGKRIASIPVAGLPVAIAAP
jgi:predicted alpha-1,2-mannosidase